MIVERVRSDDGRSGRIFVRDAAHVEEACLAFEQDYYDDLDHDRERHRIIRALLAAPRLTVDVAPKVGHNDALDVLVRAPDGTRVTACVLVSGEHLMGMLHTEPFVVETFWFEVAPGYVLTEGCVERGIRAWLVRNYAAEPHAWTIPIVFDPPLALALAMPNNETRRAQ